MYGLEAISAHNGWAMAFAGALIVISGLVVLSAVISQLHRVAALLERSPKVDVAAETEKPVKKPPPARAVFSLESEIDVYRTLAEELGGSFELQPLYEKAAAEQRPHVHLTIRSLREQGYLVAGGQGKFSWQNH